MILFNILLFAYPLSHIISFIIKTFKSWREAKLTRKVIGILLLLLLTFLMLFMVLNIFIRGVVGPRSPYMPFYLPLNSSFVQSVNAQVPIFLQDLAHLRDINSNLTRAYDKISIQGAWDAINDAEPPLHPVIIGILDTGLDKSHPEFENVKTGSSRGINLQDPSGHGTSVAGIIGANNVLGTGGTLPADSPQMNGIVSGVLGIDYTIEMRAAINTTEIPLIVRIVPQKLLGLPSANAISFLSFIENLDLAGVQIINMSFAGTNCSEIPNSTRAAQIVLGIGCIPDEDFAEETRILEEVIKAHSNILFVAGADNDGIDAQFTTPANIDANNLITVAATNLEDERADPFLVVGSSNFGSIVDIAAPGVSVYAPTVGGGYTFFSGTSAAAPMVTAVAAKLLAINPELTPQQLATSLKTAFQSE